ncbi:MAG: ABC transporter ATP-binding protein [Oscillospiraceae bacterium]|nr:ABC transporter ATP-binding protein [Oscillospiraceae bacterium]
MAGTDRQERKRIDDERNQKLKIIKKSNAKIFRQFYREKKRCVPADAYVTRMNDPGNILEIDNLNTYFYTDVGTVRAVNGVTIDIPSGKTVGIVGESGCGKSVTSLSILRLLQEPQGQIMQGALRLNTGGGEAVDLVKLPAKAMSSVRGRDISMIFQEPMTSLNPVITVGQQMDEVMRYHNDEKLSKRQISARSIAMLGTVGIANAEGVYKSYPQELSGGMRQRVVIALALLCNPKLIIADEPTTALDVTIQAQILELLRELKEKINASIMFITHDLGVIAETSDYVVVMYAGRVVEQGDAREVFHHPLHPYTIGLMESRPGGAAEAKRLYSIPGSVPNPIELPDHCYFRSRCEMSVAACRGRYPQAFALNSTHKVACYRYLLDQGGG